MEGKIDASEFIHLEDGCFHTVDNRTLAPNDLDTGDIILFSRRCSDMSLFGAVLCFAAKQFSPWDHICVVVKDPETGKVYAVEAALNGVELYEVDDRIRHSKAPAIAIRYLRYSRTDKQRQEAWETAKEMAGKPYMSDPDTLLKAGIWSPQKVKRMLMQNELYFLERRINEVDQSLKSMSSDPLTLSLLDQSLSTLKREHDNLSVSFQKERRSRLESNDSSSEFFCSHSVAVILKRLGVLPDAVPATEYLPFSFTSEVETPLLKGASFSKEVFLRGTKKELFRPLTEIMDITTNLVKSVSNTITENATSLENTSPMNEVKAVPHSDVTSVLSTDDIEYILTQLALTRALGRSSQESRLQLLRHMILSYHIPGDVVSFRSTKLLLTILLRGTLQFKSFNEAVGETTIESREPLSLMGIAASPSDPVRFARITSGDVAVLGCADGKEFHSVRKEAFGIHRMERVRLAREMKNHPAFARLNSFDRFLISLFFYKVKLQKGETILRQGKVPQFLLFVDEGTIQRDSSNPADNTQEINDTNLGSDSVVMTHGSFPAVESLMHGRPSDATYTVQSDNTVLFVLPPAVFEAFAGNRPLCAMHLLEQLRGPSISGVVKMVEAIAKSFHFTPSEELVQQMRTSFSAIWHEEPFEVDEEMENRLGVLSSLMREIFPLMSNVETEKPALKSEETNEESDWFEIPTLVETVFQVITSAFVRTDGEEKQEEESIEQPMFSYLSNYSDGHVMSVIQSLLCKDPIDSAKYLLFLQLCGETELVTLSKERFVRNAKAVGILTEQNQAELVEFFFGSSSVLTFDSFLSKLQSPSVPLIITSSLRKLQGFVEKIAPDQTTVWEKQQQLGIRNKGNRTLLKLFSPFQLLSLPFPVPYVMTYSLRFPNYKMDYWKYIAGGFFGEIFGRFILYPMYLSSFTHLVESDITPTSLFSILRKKSGNNLNTGSNIPVTSTNETPNQTGQILRKKNVSPITITDQHSKEILNNRGNVANSVRNETPVRTKAVNPLVGGFGRYITLLFVERSVQLIGFPYFLRTIMDHEITADLSKPIQSLIAGGLVGACVSVFRHPLERSYFRHILGIPKESVGSLLRRMYSGLLISVLHNGLLNAVLFGSFTYFWELNNASFSRNWGLDAKWMHRRDELDDEGMPVHYELLGKSVISVTCAYTAAELICYPIGVYRNVRMLRSMGKQSLSPLVENASSLRTFLLRTNKRVLYGGLWTRVCWSVISCSMGMALGSAFLTKNYRDLSS